MNEEASIEVAERVMTCNDLTGGLHIYMTCEAYGCVTMYRWWRHTRARCLCPRGGCCRRGACWWRGAPPGGARSRGPAPPGAPSPCSHSWTPPASR